MKKHLIIRKNDSVIFDGDIMSIPIKDSYLTSKSIELFNDDDPCIIHKSYIIKGYTDEILDLFKAQNDNLIYAKDHLSVLDKIDFMDVSKIVLELRE